MFLTLRAHEKLVEYYTCTSGVQALELCTGLLSDTVRTLISFSAIRDPNSSAKTWTWKFIDT